jgi:hypothetical protein
MALPFHTIWLGGRPPLQALDNLVHLLDLSGAHLSGSKPTGSLPLLWLDRSAREALLLPSPAPWRDCPIGALPQRVLARHAALALPPATPLRWLRFERQGQTLHLPALPLDELAIALADPWQSLDGAAAALRSLARDGLGARFLDQELGLADPGATPLLDGPQLFTYLHTLFEHARRHWARHGLLCLASDLLRLLALAWLPGAYGDLGDVAGRLRRLPGAADAGPAGFCAHHTVAIENDLILATNRTILQAITLATALWSWRHVRGIASRLGIAQPQASPAEQLRAVLPHLDQRLPPIPSLLPLFQPPWTRLADYINLAYGAQPLFHPAATLAAYAAGRDGKERLINDVGGLTGYQKAAHHLVPDNAITWARFATPQQLLDYAPQLGWKTYGFGTMDRLIDLGQRLHNPHAPAATVNTSRPELGLLAVTLDLPVSRLESIARLCHQLHHQLSRAHLEPQHRSACLAQVERICHQCPALA